MSDSKAHPGPDGAPPLPVTRVEMDAWRCQSPTCTHADHHATEADKSIFAACHRDGGLDAMYERGSGALLLRCHVCKLGVIRIQVATAVPS